MAKLQKEFDDLEEKQQINDKHLLEEFKDLDQIDNDRKSENKEGMIDLDSEDKRSIGKRRISF